MSGLFVGVMNWIDCWLKEHVWRDGGVAMSHPNIRSKSCQRCGKRQEIVTTIGN